MSYEIVSSVVFALILFRLIEDGVDYAAEKLLKYKRDKEFKDLMTKLEANFSSGRLTNVDDKTCGDPYCELCDDGYAVTIPVIKKKPVKRAATKAKAVRRPVKKAVAKKKTAKRK